MIALADNILLKPECTIDKQNPLRNCAIEVVHSPVIDKLVLVVVDDDDLSNAIVFLGGWDVKRACFCNLFFVTAEVG